MLSFIRESFECRLIALSLLVPLSFNSFLFCRHRASKSRDSFSLSDLLSSLPSEIQVPELASRGSTKQDDAAKDLPEIPSAFFDSLSLNPDPELLSKLLKDNRRMDLAHSLLIEVLDAYVGYGRERKRSGSGGAGLNKE